MKLSLQKIVEIYLNDDEINFKILNRLVIPPLRIHRNDLFGIANGAHSEIKLQRFIKLMVLTREIFGTKSITQWE